MKLPQTSLAHATNNVPFRTPFAIAGGGNQPNFSDRKRYVQYNSAFSGNSTVVLSSASRHLGTINNAIIAYAVSLQSLTLPVTWPNLTRDSF